MNPLALSEVAALAGGRLAPESSSIVTGVSTDTRRLAMGNLFVAIRGARDGNEFLPEALARGAAGAMVREGTVVPDGLPALFVDEPISALARLAAGVRGRLPARVVAITGSSGKTTTKDFTSTVLSSRFRVVAAEASFNNEIGVPLTVLAADDGTEVIIAEVGARGAGHIRLLCPVLRHDVAVVTNVGVAHHGMFGSVEAIGKAKSELVEAVPETGAAMLNADDSIVSGMAGLCRGSVVLFGAAGEVRADNAHLDADARVSFTLATPEGAAAVQLPVAGEHMVPNALAAAAVGRWFGIDVAEIAASLATISTGEHRMRVIEAPGGWRVLDDSYNANPSSMIAGLKTLVAMGRGRRTWAVIGAMAELGDIAGEEHDRIGRMAVRLGIGRLVTVGEDARALHEAARLEGMTPEEAVFAPDAVAAAKVVLHDAAPGDVILVKASRAAGLERVVEAIAE